MARQRWTGREARVLRVLTKKKDPPEGLCILVENGIPCPNPRKSRGLCNKHAQYLYAHNRLDEFALPRQAARDRRHTFSVKPKTEPGVCRVIVNGEPCPAPAKRRGLCDRHYNAIWQRPDLDLNDFGLPLHARERIQLRKKIVAGVCRVRENSVDCTGKAGVRGLCRRHRRWLRANAPFLLEQIAAPDPKAREYTLRRNPRSGRCRAAVNGRGCSQAAAIRGLCRRHYDVLHGRPDLFERIALPARGTGGRQFEKRAEVSEHPMQCVVVENGTPCSRPPERQGVCGYHRKLIGNHKDYSLNDFYSPKATPLLARKELEETADGLCCAIEDGEHCHEPPSTRGLCRRHHRMAVRQGVLDCVALPSRRSRTRFGAGNDRPHFYLDKNVLFDYADRSEFGTSGQAGSVVLVEQVMQGNARASVSTDAIKSTYNHVRHRLVRSKAEGGRELPEEEAEAAARELIQRTFYRGGAWRVLSLDASTFRSVVSASRADLSVEDALEFQAYQLARAKKAGPTMFVTRDGHFPEGVHPSSLARELGWA